MTLRNDPLKERWHVVGPPWLQPGLSPYIIAGHHDPHLGMPVVDMMDPEEWSDSCEAEPFDVWAVAQHIVDLHNAALDAAEKGHDSNA